MSAPSSSAFDPPRPAVAEVVLRALAEDLGPLGDITAALVPPSARVVASMVARGSGVLAGRACATETFRQVEPAIEVDWVRADGDRVANGDHLAVVAGPLAAVLTAERTALNFLCHLSGVATLTARFAGAVTGTGATILDTRKTTPGLRSLEKAAVVAGGGRNHRMGLYDAFLIKENHIAVAGGLAEAIGRARAAAPDREVEIECRDAGEVAEALEAGADRLLLDNMDAEGLRAAVSARDAAVEAGGHRALLEASGGVTLETVAAIAETGVDFVSVGALTHSAPALDLSMLVVVGD